MTIELTTYRPAWADRRPLRWGAPNFRIYRNLNDDCWSVQVRTDNGWRVGAHATCLIADGCTFSVSQPVRDRVRRTRRKEVHAYVLADVVTFPDGDAWLWEDARNIEGHAVNIGYSPYAAYDTFVAGQGGNLTPVEYAPTIYFSPHGRAWATEFTPVKIPLTA